MEIFHVSKRRGRQHLGGKQCLCGVTKNKAFNLFCRNYTMEILPLLMQELFMGGMCNLIANAMRDWIKKNCMSDNVFWATTGWPVFGIRKQQMWSPGMDKLLKNDCQKFSVRNIIKMENFVGIFKSLQRFESNWLSDLPHFGFDIDSISVLIQLSPVLEAHCNI